ncbi:hypothetical protein AB0J82_32275 [Asanoa sp. NPDC049518]|uniref:hypothetical protein n=1 Tax=unclassified Asanoa TaxID=2685164 RepID=UPI00343D43B3
MRVGWRDVVAVGCAVGAAVFWGIDLAFWQPLTERSGELVLFSYAENNTYWARDLRFSAVVAIGLAILLAGRGARLSRWAALGVGATWIGADLLLNRADVHGDVAAVVLSVAGAAAALAAALVVRRKTRGDEGERRPLALGAAVSAALAPLVAGIESPTDTEAALTPAAVTLGALLTVLTLGLALAAAPELTAMHRITTGAVLVAAAGGLALARVLEPGSQLGSMMLLGTVQLTAVGLLTGALPRGAMAWLKQLPKLLVPLVLYPALVLFTVLVTAYLVRVPAWFTALGGNVPVNAADSDTLYALTGVVSGLLIGWLLLVIERALVVPERVEAPREAEAVARS